MRFAHDSLVEGDGFELPVPREEAWSFDGYLSLAPFKSLRVSTKTTRFLIACIRLTRPDKLTVPVTVNTPKS